MRVGSVKGSNRKPNRCKLWTSYLAPPPGVDNQDPFSNSPMIVGVDSHTPLPNFLSTPIIHQHGPTLISNPIPTSSPTFLLAHVPVVSPIPSTSLSLIPTRSSPNLVPPTNNQPIQVLTTFVADSFNGLVNDAEGYQSEDTGEPPHSSLITLNQPELDSGKFEWAHDIESLDSGVEDKFQDIQCSTRISFMDLLRNMEEVAAEIGVNNPNSIVDEAEPQAQDEDDGLVSDSGDDSSQCAENLEEREEIVQSEEVANFISMKLAEVKEILGVTEIKPKTNDPLLTNKERKIGIRSQRRKKRAAILRQVEGRN